MTTKYLSAAGIVSLILLPVVVFGQDSTSVGVDVEANTSVTASSTAPDRPRPPLLPKLGPAVKKTIENTREGIKNTASSTREAVKTRVDAVQSLIAEKREAVRAAIEEKRAALMERAELVKEKAKERFGVGVEHSVKNIVDKLSGAVDRLTNIVERAQSHIEKLEAAGKSMAQSAELLATVRANITLAQDKITAVSVALEAALGSNQPKEQMQAVRTAAQAAQEALRTVKKSLEDLLRSIKVEAGVGAETNTTITQ